MSRDVVFYEHVFPYQKVQDTSNETNSLNIHYQSFFTEDQPVLSQSSQVIHAPYDNDENNSNNNCELNIDIPEDVCSRIDQNLNEDHYIEQNFESDQSI